MWEIFKPEYKTKKGFLRSSWNDKVREATLRIYPTGILVVEYFTTLLEVEETGKYTYRVKDLKNECKFTEFIATEL